MSASMLCLVHCLALPFFLLFLPTAIGLFAQSEGFHYVALALVLPSAVAAFWLGYRRHRDWRPVLAGLAGIICLIIALLPEIGEGMEVGITVTGSLLLVVGHGMNWRLRARWKLS